MRAWIKLCSVSGNHNYVKTSVNGWSDCALPLPHLQEASGVLAEVAELTSQNQALNKTFMALAGEHVCACVCMCMRTPWSLVAPLVALSCLGCSCLLRAPLC